MDGFEQSKKKLKEEVELGCEYKNKWRKQNNPTSENQIFIVLVRERQNQRG